MEPVSMAAAGIAADRVVGFLRPIVLKKADELAQKLGSAAVDKISGWLLRLKDRWQGDGEANSALSNFEQDPERHSEALESVLASRIVRDDQLAGDIDELIKGIGPRVVVNMRGDDIDVMEGPEFGAVRRGRVDVDMHTRRAQRMSGPKFGDIG